MSASPGASRVLDASALLAYLGDEPGSDAVEQALVEGAAMSAVNWAEVLTKAAEAGKSPAALTAELEGAGLFGEGLQVVALVAADGPAIARLRPLTRALGLSLADRACLALAQRLDLPALTTDREWARLGIGAGVELAR